MRWNVTGHVPSVIVFGWSVVIVGLFGCGHQAAEAPPPTPRTTVAGPTGRVAVGIQVGNLAPEIVGEDVDGKTFRLSDYRGRVVVLDFWGDW